MRHVISALVMNEPGVLASVSVPAEQRSEVIEIVTLFRGRIVDVAKGSLMVEIAGTEEKIEALVELIRPYGIKELARTGVIAMARGTQQAKDEAAEKPAT